MARGGGGLVAERRTAICAPSKVSGCGRGCRGRGEDRDGPWRGGHRGMHRDHVGERRMAAGSFPISSPTASCSRTSPSQMHPIGPLERKDGLAEYSLSRWFY
jgi:hypothetical protein